MKLFVSVLVIQVILTRVHIYKADVNVLDSSVTFANTTHPKRNTKLNCSNEGFAIVAGAFKELDGNGDVHDVAIVKELLEQSGLQVLPLYNASKATIREEVMKIARINNISDMGLIFIYLIGHGYSDSESDYLKCPGGHRIRMIHLLRDLKSEPTLCDVPIVMLAGSRRGDNEPPYSDRLKNAKWFMDVPEGTLLMFATSPDRCACGWGRVGSLLGYMLVEVSFTVHSFILIIICLFIKKL